MTALVAALAAVLGLAACNSARAAASRAPTGTTARPVGVAGATPALRLGVLAPLSGPASGVGTSVEHGVELAVSQYNVDNPTVRVVVDAADTYNGSAGPAGPARAAGGLIADQVVAVIGPVSSGQATAAEPVLGRAGIPSVSPSAANPVLADEGWAYFHRVVADDGVEAGGDADYLVRALGDKEVAVIDDSTAYGEGVADVVRSAVVIAGGTDVFDGHVLAGGINDGTLVGAILAVHPSGVFFGGYGPAAGHFFEDLRSAGYLGAFMTDSGAENSQFLSAAGDGTAPAGDGLGTATVPGTNRGPSADGAYFSCVCANVANAPRAAAFETAYRAQYGTVAPPYAAEAYDATTFVLAAIASGAVSPAAVNSYLASHSHAGVTKTLRFLPDGDIAGGVAYVSQVKAGQIVAVTTTS